jgi:hypothetical protein
MNAKNYLDVALFKLFTNKATSEEYELNESNSSPG